MEKETMVIKVMTYNLHKGRNLLGRRYDMERLKDILDRESCDIVFLQEAFGVHKFKKETFTHSQSLSDDNWKGHAFSKSSIVKKFEHGNSIISKKPMSKVKKIDLTLTRFEKRSAVMSLIDFGDFKIQCICTHLNLRKADRLKQAKILLTFIQQNEQKDIPMILAGDLNDGDGSVSKLLTTQGGFKASKIESSLLTYPSIKPFLSLDKVLVKNLEITECKVGRSKVYRTYSDHLPLFVNLNI